MNATQKSGKGATAKTKTYEGFTGEERDAMKERAKELKTAARRGSGYTEVSLRRTHALRSLVRSPCSVASLRVPRRARLQYRNAAELW